MKTPVERLSWALTTCRKIQVRLTPVRCSILTYLAAQRTPVNLASISQAHGVKNHCDETTVYRTLMLFKDADLVRLVGTSGKAAHYVLNIPDDSSHFIICERCGKIVELQVPPKTSDAIHALARQHGFAGNHEHLEVQGLCERCATPGDPQVTSKFLPRHMAKPNNHSTDHKQLHTMNHKIFLSLAVAFCLGAGLLQAQDTATTNNTDSLERKINEMQQRFEKIFREQQQEIEALKQQIANATNAPPAQAQTNATVTERLEELDQKVGSVIEAQKKVRPGEFNPSIGFVGETIFSYNSRNSNQTGSDRPGGFDVNQRTMELDLAAAIDPFAKGYAVINASADAQSGEANVAVEEAALQTTSLPWNLELKAGRFFGEFGRLAYIHDHELPFVNRPLVLDNYIQGESQTDGAQLNWLPPLPHYVSVTAGIGDKFGDDANFPGPYRNFTDLAFWGRVSSYFELTPNWQVEGGISGLWQPSADNGEPGEVQLQERRVAGLDLRVSYLPLANNQFKSLVWGTEVLYSDNRYLFDPNGDPHSGDEFNSTTGSVGLYSYMTYKWHRQWSAGFLFEWLQDAVHNNQQSTAYSPYITWALSHWNQVRLQYTHTDHNDAAHMPSDDAIYLQWAWIIGSHSHGWQAR